MNIDKDKRGNHGFFTLSGKCFGFVCGHENNGPPAQSPPFAQPDYGQAERVPVDAARVLLRVDPGTGETLGADGTDVVYEKYSDGRSQDHAYLVGRRLAIMIHGVVKECTVLRFRNFDDDDALISWETTEVKAAVKIKSKERIHQQVYCDESAIMQDPRERLSLLEVKNHPWVLLEAATEEEVSELMSREPTV